ncbi:MAG TPA: thioesterase family protein [Casimicrobiaceae bacterium]|nr:thioesterase family protein [Casimicrobiaceae bacterium]
MTLEPCETRLDIPSEWTDRNGHMNVAYYVVAFDRATDAFYDALGIGFSYLDRTQRSVFTLSMNVDYLGEVFAGDSVRIVTRLIDCDHKRLHYFHEMHHATKDHIVATSELLAMHVNMTTRRGEPFSSGAQALLAQVKGAHARLPLPPQVGRKIGIRVSR